MNRTTSPGWRIVASPGYPFIFVSLGVAVLAWRLGWDILAGVGFLAAAFFLYFFRDPERAIPEDAAAIVSPADGRVIRVDEAQEEQFLQSVAKRVAIFMNVFDVHVNRAPVAGQVAAAKHTRRRFLAAFKDEAEKTNERQATLLTTDQGAQVLVVDHRRNIDLGSTVVIKLALTSKAKPVTIKGKIAWIQKTKDGFLGGIQW